MKAVTFECAHAKGWTTEPIRMMRGDDDLLSNGFHGWRERCF
jgi:hypothetical protein